MKQNEVFSPMITNIQARIGGIAEKMNFYTAETENKTKTVKFNLERSTDGTIMSNATVMLFPLRRESSFGTDHYIGRR